VQAQVQPRLDDAIEAIRVRFGSQALTRAAELPPPPAWPSGTPLDRLTGIGGLPRGRLSLLVGSGTCGKLTLALNLLAGATHEFAHAVVIDAGFGFDPGGLVPFEPERGSLTVVRPPAPDAAGEAASALARAGAGFILLMGEVPEPWLGPMESGASRSGAVVAGVVETPGRALAHASSLSLGFANSGWIYDRRQLVGLKATVSCTKNKLAPPIGESELEIRYPLGLNLELARVSERPAARWHEEEMPCESAAV
jgi:recombination protein RecA